ncbi:uncharacterized protein CMU_017450 [Cryptosporidium muris RN66]|uniref:Uncharacterized protein n=1 Tax=Cryptosporidium muris (strain RN66) TaxID=441375 RepID=B6ACY8_CRYMR|nr:uncharacterized protein CMU_017450 [Cryptosporidium muris RN66]EEA05992.1 hypothetical protein, conserved [Cryptosporidium muris RN66]|eukprot:XP_002140341.1 hypothetical protein [Cryptosporidium muris RN66]
MNSEYIVKFKINTGLFQSLTRISITLLLLLLVLLACKINGKYIQSYEYSNILTKINNENISDNLSGFGYTLNKWIFETITNMNKVDERKKYQNIFNIISEYKDWNTNVDRSQILDIISIYANSTEDNSFGGKECNVILDLAKKDLASSLKLDYNQFEIYEANKISELSNILNSSHSNVFIKEKVQEKRSKYSNHTRRLQLLNTGGTYPVNNQLSHSNLLNNMGTMYPNTGVSINGIGSFLSTAHPALRLVVSTVLMVLGGTPHGAVAVLVIVTVYSIIEIATKFIQNKAKNQNLAGTIGNMASIMKTNQSAGVANINTESRSVNGTQNNFQDNTRNIFQKQFRQLNIEAMNKIPRMLIEQIYRNLQVDEIYELQMELLVDTLESAMQDYMCTGCQPYKLYSEESKSLELLPKLTELAIVELLYSAESPRRLSQSKDLLNSKLMKYKLYQKLHSGDLLSISKSIKEQLLSNPLPNWYRKLCLTAASTQKNDINIETPGMQWPHFIVLRSTSKVQSDDKNDSWLPVVLNNSQGYEVINTELEHDTHLTEQSKIYTRKTHPNRLDIPSQPTPNNINEFFYSLHNISDINYGLNGTLLNYEPSRINQNGQNESKVNTESTKWYDGMIKYSIQNYRQKGVRGVITMILDIFTAIFSATPIGFLIVTLVRLIAFMTDKLILLARRRSNQEQLIRLLLEIPHILDDKIKLNLTFNETNQIIDECKSIEGIIIRTFRKVVMDLYVFSYEEIPSAKVLNAAEYGMARILQASSGTKYSSNQYNNVVHNKERPKHIPVYNEDEWTIVGIKEKQDQPMSQDTEDLSDFNQKAIQTSVKEDSGAKVSGNSYTNKSESIASKAKHAFQGMVSGLKNFLLQLFKSILGGATEIWHYVKGLILRIIEFVKELWKAIRSKDVQRQLIETLQDSPQHSVVHSVLLKDIYDRLLQTNP